VGLTILADKSGPSIDEVLDALLSLESDLHPESILLRVDEAAHVAGRLVVLSEYVHATL
jgi:hypothetical protein